MYSHLMECQIEDSPKLSFVNSGNVKQKFKSFVESWTNGLFQIRMEVSDKNGKNKNMLIEHRLQRV